ncbi:MAG: poly(R)-hydroxyalkanoic acid synthase subunit PhaE [Nitrososphaeraceae archaeon]
MTEIQNKDDDDSIIKSLKFKSLNEKWAEIMKLPQIGPINAFSRESHSYISNLFLLNQTLVNLQLSINEYWTRIISTYVEAVNDVTVKTKSNPLKDNKDLQNVLIDAFEDAFNSLFTSGEFAKGYNKVSNDQLEFSKVIHKIMDKNLSILNLPTRRELDLILKDLHEVKNEVRNIKRAMNAYNKHSMISSTDTTN